MVWTPVVMAGLAFPLLLPATESLFVVGDPFHEIQVELTHHSQF